MPLVKSTYKAPWFLPSGHLQTAFPHFRRVEAPLVYDRERIETPDDDFLDLDWSRNGSRKLVILCHGLEGNSRRTYMTWASKVLLDKHIDVLAWNYRGCSGEPNRNLIYYHAGATYDLATVISHALDQDRYEKIALVGYSLGGNLMLKYLGENASQLPVEIHGGVAFSVPVDLKSGAHVMAKKSRRAYTENFLTTLREKVRWKAEMFPDKISTEGLDEITTFLEFDERYIAPMHGFSSADDYWAKSSARPYLPFIQVPTLLVNARNDPFLAPPCFPVSEAKESSVFYFEAPTSGGHTGFPNRSGRGPYWSDHRMINFLLRTGF